jgi:hypothetical protein
MPEFAPTNWVEGVTKVGPTRMNALEQGVKQAGKQAVLVAGTATKHGTGQPATNADDNQRVVWTRQADGSYLASDEVLEQGVADAKVLTKQSRVRDNYSGNVPTAGAVTRNILEATKRGVINGSLQERGARLVAEVVNGGRVSVYVIADTDDGGYEQRYLLDDTGASDFGPATLPTARVYRNTTFAMGANGGGIVNMSTARYDNWAMWSSLQPARLTVPEAGVYVMAAHLTMTAANPTGNYIQPLLRRNGVNWVGASNVGVSQFDATVATTLVLGAGDYIELHVFAGPSGGTISAGTAADYRLCDLAIAMISS